jgi:hypothetical protein
LCDERPLEPTTSSRAGPGLDPMTLCPGRQRRPTLRPARVASSRATKILRA